MKARRVAIGTVLVLGALVALSVTGVFAQAGGDSAAAGKTVFDNNCSACHQASGAGIPATFPPLAGYVPKFLDKGADGRTTLMHIVLFGMTGQISADGQSYNSTMPTWGKILSDQQVTDVLNYITTAWGNDKAEPKDFKPFTLDEVKKAAGANLTPDQTRQERAKLGL